MVHATFYTVGNHKQEFLGAGRTGWTPDLAKARIYQKPGGARNRVTSLASGGDIPNLVELHVTEVVTISEKERVEKSRNRKARHQDEQAAREAQYELDRAQRQMKEAQATIVKYGGRI